MGGYYYSISSSHILFIRHIFKQDPGLVQSNLSDVSFAYDVNHLVIGPACKGIMHHMGECLNSLSVEFELSFRYSIPYVSCLGVQLCITENKPYP